MAQRYHTERADWPPSHRSGGASLAVSLSLSLASRFQVNRLCDMRPRWGSSGASSARSNHPNPYSLPITTRQQPTPTHSPTSSSSYASSPTAVTLPKRCIPVAIFVGTLSLLAMLLLQFGMSSRVSHQSKQSYHTEKKSFEMPKIDRCAINLYGLPRSFQSLVLPSLKEHVIIPNAPHGCDYFVHYYDQSQEPAGRSGQGGRLHTNEIKLLKSQVERLTEFHGGPPRQPTVLYTSDTEDQFWNQHQTLLDKVRNATDPEGRYLYFPWKAKTYTHPLTTDNILKMWHSLQSVWNLMQQHAKSQGFEYTRVAMLRSDVVYVTPIHIYESSPGVTDSDNRVAIVPAFGKHPVSDRLMYGPYKAVEIWASQRFQRLEAHIQHILKTDPGWGMHSERFVERALFPPIQKLGYTIMEHPTLCFFRARADESVWITDCNGVASVAAPTIAAALGNPRQAVETLLHRKCGNITTQRRPIIEALDCSTQQSKPKRRV